jgi:hypothetical protein
MDENRNGTFEPAETNRLSGGSNSEAVSRISNWGRFVRDGAGSARQAWNRDNRGWRPVAQAIALLTQGDAGQNNTGWAGNAGGGETAFWADLALDATPFLAHESGHAFGLPHGAGCSLGLEAYDLLSGMRQPNATHLMCPSLGGGPGSFFLPRTNYNGLLRLFRSSSAGTGLRAASAMTGGPQAAGGGGPATEFHLAGWIHQDTTVEIVTSFVATNPEASPINPNPSPWTVTLLDGFEAVLAEFPFWIDFEASDAELVWPWARFDLSVPFPDETAHVEVRKSGLPRLRLRRSANPPTVADVLATVMPGPEPDLKISWTASDLDGDPLTALLSQSTDGGAFWVPLPVGAAASPTFVPLEGLPGGSNVVVKVTVSDGFHTAKAVSAPFALPNQPPVAVILSPLPGQLLSRGDIIPLAGLAWDAEATGQTQPSLDWYLVDGGKTNWLGNTATTEVGPLPVGKPLIRLVATDADGATSSDEQLVQILDLAPPPQLYAQWLSAARLQLSWEPEPNTVLESATELGPQAVWTPVAEADLTNGVLALAGDDLRFPTRFYRLARQ